MKKLVEMPDGTLNEGFVAALNLGDGATQSEIELEAARLLAEYADSNYSRLRSKAYSQLNQDEMRFDDVTNGTTTWVDAINAIKEEFPK